MRARPPSRLGSLWGNSFNIQSPPARRSRINCLWIGGRSTGALFGAGPNDLPVYGGASEISGGVSEHRR